MSSEEQHNNKEQEPAATAAAAPEAATKEEAPKKRETAEEARKRREEARAARKERYLQLQKEGKWRREVPNSNEQLEEYYAQNGVMDAAQFEQYLAAMRTPLPTTFRVTRGTYMEELVLARLRALQHAEGIDESARPRPLPWYPSEGAWYVATGRAELRKNAALGELKRFLVAQNEQGNITRQEAVSMIPPLVLDVRPEHRVLDMCAAPGSKTTELLELLHAGCAPGTLPTGVVVANDVDIDRCFMLVHQTKRMSSPCFVVTCHDAERYPRRAPSGADFGFDRVLCDVPCSGDGTLRKNVDVWKKWHPRMALRQHRVQLAIARRGAFLLRPGGRLVYSTCSLNPIEDEAVVAELLRTSGGQLRLVDVSAQLPELRRAAGISTWRVYLDKGTWAAQPSDLAAADVPARLRKLVSPSCFAPTPEEAADMHLERCMRILPHLQDTGGFFVAVLEKSPDAPAHPEDPLEKKTPAETTAEEEGDDGGDDDDEEKKKKKEPTKPGQWGKKSKRGQRAKDCDEPLRVCAHMPGAAAAFDAMREFYGVDGSKFAFDQLVTRNKDLSKLLFVSRGILDLVAAQEERDQHQQPQPQQHQQMTIVHAGLKMFQVQHMRQSVACNFRLSMESLRWIVPALGPQRVVEVPLSAFVVLLTEADPRFDQFDDAAFRERLAALTPGCYVLKVREYEHMYFCAWRGAASTHLLVSKKEIASLCNILAPEKQESTTTTAAAAEAPAPAAAQKRPRDSLKSTTEAETAADTEATPSSPKHKSQATGAPAAE